MEVCIISREIIKPSSSTSNNLRTHKLSLLDQSNLKSYFSFILFYSKPCKSYDHNLKKSLSETLTHFCPLAGRVKDCFSVECGDYGVTFIEAQVTGNTLEVLQRPEIDLLKPLLPHHEQSSTQANMSVQVNYFDCGQVAIAVGFRHVVADATTAANFINCWATIARGGKVGNLIKNVIFDCTSIFPPLDLSGLSVSKSHSSITKTVTKRFVFDGSKIAAMRDSIGKGMTRFEAMSVLIWNAVIAAKRATNESIPGEEFHAIIPISLRKKMNLPLENCIGNIFTPAIATWPSTEETIDFKSLARKLHDSIYMVNEEYVRKAYADGKELMKMINVFARDTESHEKRMLFITSLCRLPIYDADFGWGKPVWMTFVRDQGTIINQAVLLDTKDGEGIEVTVMLPEVDMAKFKQDPTILAYASFNPFLNSSI